MERISKLFFLVMVLAFMTLLVLPPTSSHAGIPPPLRLFGTVGTSAGTSHFVELDPVTGAVIQTFGHVGHIINSMDYDPVSDKIYATTIPFDETFRNGLLIIDPLTGKGTPVGSGFGAEYSPITNINADPTGALFGWSEAYDSLVSINPLTGTASLVGPSGIGTWAHGMSFNSSGTLYFVNGDGSIYTVDTVTGAATFTSKSIGTYAHHGDFHPVTGKYWGISEPRPDPKYLRVIDVTSGTIEQNLRTIDGLHTITFVSLPVISVHMYGTTSVGSGSSNLVELDPVSGALIQTIGQVGYQVTGMDYNPVSQKIYASTSSSDPAFPDGLLTIDPLTGAGTPVGSGFGPTYRPVTNLCADPTGVLFGWSEWSGLSIIDPITGTASLVHPANFGTYNYGMAFNGSGTFYFVNGDGKIWTVDPVTGLGTNTGISLRRIAHNGDFHPASDMYWGIDSLASRSTKNLVVSDVTNGKIHQILPTVNNLRTLTFVPGNVIPTFTVTPVAGTGGSITPDTSQTVSYYQTTSFTITPDSGYGIDSVSGCNGSLSGNTYTTGPVYGACTVTATFRNQVAKPDYLTVTPGRIVLFYTYFTSTWGTSTTPRVTYELQRSTNGGPFKTVYRGSSKSKTEKVASNSNFVYRVRATRSGYLPSEWVYVEEDE